MFILSIINAAIILLVNSLRIEDAIAAFHSSDFEAVFWISVFLAAVDALAILIILDRPYSKYLYPIELLLYFSYLHFSGIQFQRYDAHFNEWFEAAKSDAAPVALPSSGENQIIGPVKRYAEFKIPGQNLIMRAEISAYFKGGFDNPRLAEIRASAIGPRKFEISFPFAFFCDWGLANRAGIEYADMTARAENVSISEIGDEKEMKVKCVLDYSYAAFASRLGGGTETAAARESETAEISYKLIREGGK